VGTCTVTQSGNTLVVDNCKEAGLGDESQINITISATALCINNGSNHPKAVNKTTATASVVVPVQNGKAQFGPVTLTAAFSPSCSPPMTVQFTDISIRDTTNGISLVFTGP
jgi:hypothetical protein